MAQNVQKITSSIKYYDLIIPNLIKIDQNSLLVSTRSATFAEKR